jgi:hypothetical protein
MDFQVRRPTRVEQLPQLFRQASFQHQSIPPSLSPTSLAIASGCSVAGSVASGNRGQRRSAHTGETVTPDLTPSTMDFQVRRPTRVEQLSQLFRRASFQHQAIPFANFTRNRVRLLGSRKRCERQPRLAPIGSHRRNRHPRSHAQYDGLPSPSTHQSRTIVSIVPPGPVSNSALFPLSNSSAIASRGTTVPPRHANS